MTIAEQWDERYSRPEFWAGREAAPFLVEVSPLLPRGLALDVAMGEGRNTIWLASNGWGAVGIDRSRAALAKAESLAVERGVRVSFGTSKDAVQSGVLLVEADLEQIPLPDSAYDVVVCFNYLQRTLFPQLESALRPGGALVYQTYTAAQLDYPEGPRDPRFLLQPGELLAAFPRLDTLYYSESNSGKGIAQLLARRPAPR